MAVEQSGAGASPGPAGSPRSPQSAESAGSEPAGSKPAVGRAAAGGGPRGQAQAQSDLDELKRKFREALERKRGVHASANAEGTQDTGKVHGSHGPAASRRSFRRKSGG